jgi:glucosylceramidase
MNPKRSLVLLFAFALCFSLASQAQSVPDAQLWLTSVDQPVPFVQQTAPLHFTAPDAKLPTIEVNDKQKFQSIEGFGFALTGGSAQLLTKMSPAARATLLKKIFSTDGDGIGVSYLRVSIGSSDMNDHVFSYDDLAAGETDPKLAKFNLGPDLVDVIPMLKEILAINPNIPILGSPWSAPAWMKTNGKVKGGELKPDCYGAYADYLVKYIESMKAQGITIHAITVENEPLNPKNTPSMVMFADQQDKFIAKYLGPDFAKAGIKTQIQLYDHNPDVASFPLSILKDPEASKYVAGTAFHLYGGDSRTLTEVHNAFPDKGLYLTEQSITAWPGDEGINIAEPVSRVLIGATRNWGHNVLIWNLAADPKFGPHTNDGGCGMCAGAVTLDGDNVKFNVAYFGLAHFSKFVRPGAVRIASNEMEQLQTAAFLNSDGKVVLVLANIGNFAKPIQISYHGKSLKVSVPSESVETYVW